MQKNETNVVIDGDDLRTDKADANTFKGFGYISCNNSSRLLVDYKWEHPEKYKQILNLLFGGPSPLMTMIKVEMGVDANTSSGTEPSTMRTANEEANVRRGAGWQLIADAKQINPELKTAVLRWGEPGWIKQDWKAARSDQKIKTRAFESMYQWYKKSIVATYETYGYLIDYIDPDRNENKLAMVDWLKWFAERLAHDNEGFPDQFPIQAYQQIKLIAADQNYETNFGDEMVADTELRNVIDAVGFHYNTDDGPERPFTKLADQYDKEVWYSEGIAPMTFAKYRQNDSAGSGVGGRQSILDVANRLIKSYYKSRRSLYLFQPAVSAYYAGVNYSHKELISAQDPWSGYIDVDDAGLQMIRHFTDFAVSGWADGKENAKVWRYITSACFSGVGGTENLDFDTDQPSYMTLAAADGSDYSVIIVNDSAVNQTYHFTLKNFRKAADKTVYQWETRARDQKEQDFDIRYRRLTETITPSQHEFVVEIKPYSLVTVTTLNPETVDHYQRYVSDVDQHVLDIQRDSILYEDDFNYSEMPSDYLTKRGGTPRYTTDQGGAFEIVREGPANHVLQQMITEESRALDWEYSYAPNLTVGDNRWMNYSVAFTAKFDLETKQNSSTANYIGIGVREQTDIKGRLEDAPYVFKLYSDGSWTVAKYDHVKQFGCLPNFEAEKWHDLKFEARGNQIQAYVDGRKTVKWTDGDNPVYSGRVKLGSGFYKTKFRQLTITKIDGFPPYAKERIDDMDDRIHYSGHWENHAGASSSDWNRTLSIGHAEGTETSLTFNFTGKGFALIGPNSDDSTLTLYLDGNLLSSNVHPAPGGHKTANYLRLDLSPGSHELKAVIESGTYVLDAVEIIG
ncbi:hypothetical protein NIE88_02780 [Sporolactobacillus shoreicorticis]|uniref:Glycosyl hydrolase n=1 Tax=Sporolactobacillus shoreicorticis TaxID=1923877 RepID=A0ABW5S278_9BACL|nr:hypothetical protein [Sporolactobacillus shoreicorticis]MCO7124701.1 hypothetical protein [Sporolactobacillus shoreicorticis]